MLQHLTLLEFDRSLDSLSLYETRLMSSRIPTRPLVP
jgi:hypothetical protein